jgi:DNA-binding CsgD family transcriptional regulator
MRLFGLSAAEARLLAALAQGSSPAAYADARSVSIATIRSQLQAIFQKVGVNSQAQLIAIARALPQVRGLG